MSYPEGNQPIFEEWFYRNFIDVKIPYGIYYLPIFWTSYHVNHKYGKNREALKELQQFVNSLDRSKQYFTIIQYDDGPLVDVPPNVKFFAMSGPRIDYPLPLICQPHKYQFNEQRDIFASFIGRKTHYIRTVMLDTIVQKPGYRVEFNILPTQEYCRILSRSIFTLCPRGYGQSSFRISEALQYGSIPVYISDEFVIPHNHDFNEYGVLIDAKDISKLHEIISELSPAEITKKWERGKEIYNEKFSFEGCKRLILDSI